MHTVYGAQHLFGFMNIQRKYLFSLLILGTFFLPSTIFAATVQYYVDPTGTNAVENGTSSGAGAWATLQYAIDNVANPTTDTIIINIAAGTYTLNNDDVQISRNFTNLTLQGAGATTTIVQPSADPSTSETGNFYITDNSVVTFKDMQIRYGRRVSAERATSAATGIHKAGSGALSIYRVWFDDNDNTNSSGRGALQASWLTMEDSLVSNSDATSGTFTRGGVTLVGGNSRIINTTFYNIRGGSSSSGAIYVSNSNNLSLINSTIYGGSVSGFGNVMVDNGGTIYMKNTLIAQTSGTGFYKGTSASVVDGGNNLVESSNYTWSGANGNITGVQGSLNMQSEPTDNGGSVPTMALLADSVAIDGGNSMPFNDIYMPVQDATGGYRGTPQTLVHLNIIVVTRYQVTVHQVLLQPIFLLEQFLKRVPPLVGQMATVCFAQCL